MIIRNMDDLTRLAIQDYALDFQDAFSKMGHCLLSASNGLPLVSYSRLMEVWRQVEPEVAERVRMHIVSNAEGIHTLPRGYEP